MKFGTFLDLTEKLMQTKFLKTPINYLWSYDHSKKCHFCPLHFNEHAYIFIKYTISQPLITWDGRKWKMVYRHFIMRQFITDI